MAAPLAHNVRVLFLQVLLTQQGLEERERLQRAEAEHASEALTGSVFWDRPPSTILPAASSVRGTDDHAGSVFWDRRPPTPTIPPAPPGRYDDYIVMTMHRRLTKQELKTLFKMVSI